MIKLLAETSLFFCVPLLKDAKASTSTVAVAGILLVILMPNFAYVSTAKMITAL
jgi:hypothetical protein